MITISRRGAALIAFAILLAIPGTALAVHQFSDVPHSSAHAEGIAWLADSGVTAGCGEGQFCPDDYVTRAQMATFMCRLSGNCATDPSVDAATVGGIDAADLLTGASAVDADTLDGLDSASFVAAGSAIDAETLDGLDSTDFVAASGTIDADTIDGLDSTGFWQHGTMAITSNDWHTDAASDDIIRYLAMPVVSGVDTGWAYNTPTLPTIINGVAYSLESARVCLEVGDSVVGLTEVGLFVEGSDGPLGIDYELYDITGWTGLQCIDVAHTMPVRLDQNRSVMMRLSLDFDAGVASIWSTTWYLVPAEAGHL